jgi:hypothetical protein
VYRKIPEGEAASGRNRLSEDPQPVVALLDLLLPVEPLWEADRASFQLLTAYAVEFRYPGEAATKADARLAMAACRRLRKQVRESLGR